MKQLATSIVIEGSSGAVWDTLLDFGAYPEWNPFVRSISGCPSVGERLSARLQNPGGKVMSITPTVTAVEENRQFSWLGKLGLKGIFDGHHHFRIEPIENGSVRFTQSEEFGGVLVPVLWRMLDTKTRAGFEAMNMALKNRVEAR